LHPFDEAIALGRLADGGFQGRTSPAYANMVGPFGGIMAAQLLNAVMQHPDRLGEPVAFTVNFAAAMADGPFTVAARPARTNRSTQHWMIELTQAGNTALTATAVTALRRETWSLNEIDMPVTAPPELVPPQHRAVPMEWAKRYEMRPVVGSLPSEWDGSDTGSSLTQLWVRDEQPRVLDYCSLTALADVFFPRVYVRRATRVPIGTVSMTVYFHADSKQLSDTGVGYLLGQARAQAFRNGFFDQTAQMWNESGALLATSHQIVYFKE
jgi:acyl-CoA thioesterase